MAQPAYDFADGTFHFFKTFSRRPGSTLGLIIWTMLLYAVLFGAIIAAFAPLFGVIFEAAANDREPTDTEVLAAFGSAWLGMAIAILGSLGVVLMIQGAWLRLLTHGRTAVGIPFRFGADELRLLGVNLCLLAFLLLGYIVGAMGFFLIIAGVSFGIGAGDAAGGAASVFGGLLFSLVILVVFVFFALRFAAAPAMTVNEGRFRLFGSFAATKGIWGWMLLSYIVIFFILFFASTVIYMLQLGVAFAGLANMTELVDTIDKGGDVEAVFEMLRQPAILIVLGAVLLLQAVYQIFADAMFHSVGAYAAVRHAAGGEPEEDISAPAASVGDAPREG